MLKPIVQRALAGHIVWSMPGKLKKLYLTFDDGPHHIYTPLVMDILEKYGIHGTFFLIGNNVMKYPEITRQIVARGHKIGNHSFTHRIEFKTGTADYKHEIQRFNEVINNAAGVQTRLIRPPWGVVPTKLLFHCICNHLKLVLWSFDSLDCKHEQNRGIKTATSGDIILLHDDARFVVDILKNNLEHLLDVGFTFSTISEQ